MLLKSLENALWSYLKLHYDSVTSFRRRRLRNQGELQHGSSAVQTPKALCVQRSLPWAKYLQRHIKPGLSPFRTIQTSCDRAIAKRGGQKKPGRGSSLKLAGLWCWPFLINYIFHIAFDIAEERLMPFLVINLTTHWNVTLRIRVHTTRWRTLTQTSPLNRYQSQELDFWPSNLRPLENQSH